MLKEVTVTTTTTMLRTTQVMMIRDRDRKSETRRKPTIVSMKVDVVGTTTR
jgi:hypothetical protein